MHPAEKFPVEQKYTMPLNGILRFDRQMSGTARYSEDKLFHSDFPGMESYKLLKWLGSNIHSVVSAHSLVTLIYPNVLQGDIFLPENIKNFWVAMSRSKDVLNEDMMIYKVKKGKKDPSEGYILTTHRPEHTFFLPIHFRAIPREALPHEDLMLVLQKAQLLSVEGKQTMHPVLDRETYETLTALAVDYTLDQAINITNGVTQTLPVLEKFLTTYCPTWAIAKTEQEIRLVQQPYKIPHLDDAYLPPLFLEKISGT